MTLGADGFLPLALSGVLAAQPNYPDGFSPVNLNTVWLHRTPTTISGRTVAHDRTVRAGSDVTVNGIWASQAALLGGPALPNLISITPGLYVDRPAGGSVRQYNVSPQIAQAKQLIVPGQAGTMEVRLSDQIGLAPGSLVIIEWPDPDRSEIILITAIVDPGASPDQPATAVLAQALSRDHPDGVSAYPAIVAAPGAANALSLAGQAGDTTLFPGTLSGLDATAVAVEVSGGSALAEYHWAPRSSVVGSSIVYHAMSDGEGYFRLPPIHRLAQIQLHATHPSEPTPLDLAVALDFGRAKLEIDLVFP
jgi:hypothetical protein